MAESGAYCLHCQAQRLYRREEPNHILHAIITLFTCGLWAVVWIVASVVTHRPWLCTVCGLEWQPGNEAAASPAVAQPPTP